MSSSLIEILVQWPKCFLTGTDIATLLNKSYDSRHAITKRAVKSGLLVKVKRDLYLIKPSLSQDLPNPFELAQLIWGPSYISFESALSFHGLIPEAVHITASACSKKGKKVTTPIGIFSFEHVPMDAFSIGLHHNKNDGSFLIAEPWKAIADMIYTRRKQWNSLLDIEKDLRIEREELLRSDLPLLKYLSEKYASPRTKNVLCKLLREIEKS